VTRRIVNHLIKLAPFLFVALFFISSLLPASLRPAVQSLAQLDRLDRVEQDSELAPLLLRPEGCVAGVDCLPLPACEVTATVVHAKALPERYSLTFINNAAVPMTIKLNTTLPGIYCPHGEIATIEVVADEHIIIQVAEKDRCANFLFKSSMVVSSECHPVSALYRHLSHAPGVIYVMHKYIYGRFEIESVMPDGQSIKDWWRLADMTDMDFYDYHDD
jgi:hypothetical protein